MLINTQNGSWGDDIPNRFIVTWYTQPWEAPKSKAFPNFREANAFLRRMESNGKKARLIQVS